MTHSPRILIIDDDINLLRLMDHVLVRAGFRVDKADTGPMGIQLAQQISPDLIVLDMMMPRMNGLEVCRQLRAQAATRQTPIIFLSALGDVKDKVRGFTVGADDYIPKPVDPEELVMRVFALLNRARMAHASVAHTISFVGAKGGVGNTTVAINVAARLAHQKFRVTLVELRPSNGVIRYLLRFKTKGIDITPLLELNPEQIKRPEVEHCLMPHSSGMNLLVAPVEFTNPLTAQHIEAIYDVLSVNTDYIIFDIPAQFDTQYRRALELSDQVLLVTEPDTMSVQCARNHIKSFRRWGVYRRLNLVVNERMPLPTGLNSVEIENRIGMSKTDPDEERWNQNPHEQQEKNKQGVICHIPSAPDLFHETTYERVPLMLVDPNSKPAHAILDMVEWLLDNESVVPMLTADSLQDLSESLFVAQPNENGVPVEIA